MIRFVSPAFLGAAIYLAAMSPSQADALHASAPPPELKPQTTLVSITSGMLTEGQDTSFPLPTLRPGAVVKTESKSVKPTALKTAGSAGSAMLDGGDGLAYDTVVVRPGDTLLSALVHGGMAPSDVRRVLTKIGTQIDARNLVPGDKITLGFISDRKGRHLALLRWNGKRAKNVTIALIPHAQQQALMTAMAGTSAPSTPGEGMVRKILTVRGSPSLPRVLAGFGLPPEVGEQLMMTLSQSRRPPVHGEIVTISYFLPRDGATGTAPRLDYAAYRTKDGREYVLHYTAYATPTDLQQTDVMPAAMVALWDPLPGARISSPFGWRIHPVFHTRLFHKGVDYEAHAGTPVVAAADGVVEDVGWRGNYGNYILIRHSGRLETAYAHLAGFAPVTAPGTHVRRGELIGYVGMTGVATGPPLYYEVIVDGRQIDPEGFALKQATKAYLTQTAGIN